MAKFFTWEVVLIVLTLMFFICTAAYISWKRYNRCKIQIRSLPMANAQICSHSCSSNIATNMNNPMTDNVINSFESGAIANSMDQEMINDNNHTFYVILMAGNRAHGWNINVDDDSRTVDENGSQKPQIQPPTYDSVMDAEHNDANSPPPSYVDAIMAQGRALPV